MKVMNFYTFDDPVAKSAMRFTPAGSEISWRAAVRGKEPAEALSAAQYMGQTAQDFAWTSLAGTPLISGKVAALLAQEGVSGWKPYSVDLFDGNGRLLADYRGLGIVGRCGGGIDFDARESALVYRSVPSGRQSPFFKGLKLIRDSWDGSDFFMDDQESLWILVSERVPRLLEKYKIKNCSFRKIEDVELRAQPSAIIWGQ